MLLCSKENVWPKVRWKHSLLKQSEMRSMFGIKKIKQNSSFWEKWVKINKVKFPEFFINVITYSSLYSFIQKFYKKGKLLFYEKNQITDYIDSTLIQRVIWFTNTKVSLMINWAYRKVDIDRVIRYSKYACKNNQHARRIKRNSIRMPYPFVKVKTE